MRIAYLCKRQYMGKDVIVDRYARLYEIPYQLARLGHDVQAYCLSYYGRETGTWLHGTEFDAGSLHWHSYGLRRSYVSGLAYPQRLLRALRAFDPDTVIAASDIPHVALGGWLARRLRRPLAVDLYDNFESFGQARIPGMKLLLRRNIRSASLVTTTSASLAKHVTTAYRARGKIVSMPSTIDQSMFCPLDKTECRRALGLPENARLIGTAGGLLATRGIDTLYAAWAQLATDESLQLVLAGLTDPDCPPPNAERVHYLGMLDHAHIAQLFNALDVGVIYLRDTLFGRYCFPQKACEMLACGLPIVGARVGVMPDLLASAPSGLYRVNDRLDLARAIRAQLTQPEIAAVKIEDWAQIISKLEKQLLAMA